MKTTKELLENKLASLGVAIDLLRNGEKMSYEQLMLIKEATDKQIRLAIMMRAASTLKGQEYTNYCYNARILAKK